MRDYEHYTQHQLNEEFVEACSDNDLDLVKYLLLSPQLRRHAQIDAFDNKALRTACLEGHIEIVKYLLTSPELTVHADIHTQYDQGFKHACEKGHLDIVKFLLTSAELSEKIDIHTGHEWGLKYASNQGHVDVVKYLLTFSEMAIQTPSHDIAFKLAADKFQLPVVEYFIFEYQLQKTADITSFLQSDLHPQSYLASLEKMFEARDLNARLHQQLSINTSKTAKVKL